MTGADDADAGAPPRFPDFLQGAQEGRNVLGDGGRVAARRRLEPDSTVRQIVRIDVVDAGGDGTDEVYAGPGEKRFADWRDGANDHDVGIPYRRANPRRGHQAELTEPGERLSCGWNVFVGDDPHTIRVSSFHEREKLGVTLNASR